MRWRSVLALLLFGMIIDGCQSRTDVDRPPGVRYGEDTCDQYGVVAARDQHRAEALATTVHGIVVMTFADLRNSKLRSINMSRTLNVHEARFGESPPARD